MTSDLQMVSELREALLAALRDGSAPAAIQAARALLRQDDSLRQLGFLRKAADKLPADAKGFQPLKVAVLSSFTLDFLQDPLIAYGLVNGLRPEVYRAGFAQFRQELLDPESGLYAFGPDLAILAVEGRDWAPAVYRDYLDRMESGFEATAAEFRGEVEGLLEAFRQRSQAPILVHNLVPPRWRQFGVLDSQAGPGQARVVRQLNGVLDEIGRNIPGVHIVDYESLVSRFGAENWYDDRMDQYAKAPIASAMLSPLAREYMKFARAMTGRSKKCLVVDLDNTLWGGVLGEEGLHGIQLGPNYPGSAYVAFQEEVLNLRKRGVILAVASKNTATDVEEVFAKHPHMVLKKEHFAEAQIHWKPKVQSLAEIAAKLNIGLAHMVFMDDDPAECQQIRRALPEVTVIQFPAQPEHGVKMLLEDGLFDVLSLSAEDRSRGELYERRAQAEALRSQSGSLEDFYRSLGMEVLFAPVSPASLPRAAQLTRKTNQFNVTTIRYSESDLRERMNDPDWLLATARVRDRFGDHGIVGLLAAQLTTEGMEIDTFLLSCRVIGRTVETAMLAGLCEWAVHRGIRRLHGRVIPTAKNAPARDVFERHGFCKTGESDSGETRWALEVAPGAIAPPEWIKMTAAPDTETASVPLRK